MHKDTNTHVKLDNPNATVDGKPIAQWSEDWLQWVFHAPASTPPGTPFGPAAGYPDGTYANAHVHNTGGVFFLYGGDWGSANHPFVPTINVAACKPML